MYLHTSHINSDSALHVDSQPKSIKCLSTNSKHQESLYCLSHVSDLSWYCHGLVILVLYWTCPSLSFDWYWSWRLSRPPCLEWFLFFLSKAKQFLKSLLFMTGTRLYGWNTHLRWLRDIRSHKAFMNTGEGTSFIAKNSW